MRAPFADVRALLGPSLPSVPVPLPLASRFASLEGKHLLLFDNGQLQPYEGEKRTALASLAQRLREQYGVAACERVQSRLGSSSPGHVRQVSERIANMDVEGVVLALCDALAVRPTVLLAWELERHGLPTATLCAEPSIPLAAALTMYVLPGLPLSPLQVSPDMGASDITAESIWVSGEVEEALTAPVEILEAQFWTISATAWRQTSVYPAGEEA